VLYLQLLWHHDAQPNIREGLATPAPQFNYKGFPNLASAFEVSISLPFSVPFHVALLASCEKVKDC
jgi:hypothetical protein